MNNPVTMTKMNGLGNKIIVADMRGRNDSIMPEAARALAQAGDTSFDQLMAIYDCWDSKTDYRVEIWNSDGSLAKACGNGTCCVAEWLYRKDRCDNFSFATVGGSVQARRLPDGLVTVDMGSPRWTWQDIPLRVAVVNTSHVALQCGLLEDASLVSMGNPHAIFFVKNAVTDYKLEDYGPKLEHDRLFPEGANISIAHVTSRTHMDLRTWERGAGLTRACGTAACASVVAACRRGLTNRQVTVTLLGGNLAISWEENDHVLMTGPTDYEFSGLFDPVTGCYTRSLD